MSATLTAQAVADLVGGRLLGNGAASLRRVAPLDEAGDDALTLAVSARYAAELRRCRAGCVLVPPALAGESNGPVTRIVVDDPMAALLRVLPALYPEQPPAPGVDSTARLGAGVALGRDVTIGPHVVLGAGVRLGDRVRVGPGAVLEDGVEVGDDSVLDAGAVVYRGSRLGRRVILKAGAVIGGAGFGYRSGPDGHRRVPHVGGCVLEDDVEIGSNSTVDRGSIGDTAIGRGTKLDNLVHVGHNVRIGEHCLLMAGVGIAGSTRIGNGVVFAGHSCAIDHVTIGDGVRVGAQAMVTGNLAAGVDVSGSPARPHREALRAQAAAFRLPAILSALEELVRRRDG